MGTGILKITHGLPTLFTSVDWFCIVGVSVGKMDLCCSSGWMKGVWAVVVALGSDDNHSSECSGRHVKKTYQNERTGIGLIDVESA